MAKVISINISEKKGTIKLPIETAHVKVDYGIVGDVHAAPGDRQVSMLAKEDFALIKKLPEGVCLKEGNFGENMTTEGIVLHTLPIGTTMKIGTAEFKVSKIGKECHMGCAIRTLVGDCIMPKRGIFVSVEKEGDINVGDEIILEENQ